MHPRQWLWLYQVSWYIPREADTDTDSLQQYIGIAVYYDIHIYRYTYRMCRHKLHIDDLYSTRTASTTCTTSETSQVAMKLEKLLEQSTISDWDVSGRRNFERIRSELGCFLKLPIHMVHLYWSIWYPPITKMIKIFNVVTSIVLVGKHQALWDMPIWFLIAVP